MLVALATHAGDRALAVPLAQHIRALGGVENHELLIVSPNGTNLAGIEDVLRGAFGRVHTHFYAETLKGWPFGANEAAYHIFSYVMANQLPFYFLVLEPDCVPIPPAGMNRMGWLNEIELEYCRCGQQVLGVTIPTVAMDTMQTVGQHTVGVAVYPKNFMQLCPLIKSLVRATQSYQQSGGMPAPWDAMFGPYTGRMTAQTQLIQHLPRNFTRNAEGMKWDCPSLEFALANVNPNAVLVHGCKHPEFLNRVTKGNYAATPRKIEHQPEHFGNVERPLVRQSEEAPRDQSRAENGSRGSDQREQKEVAFTGTKEEIKLAKQKARAKAKRDKYMEGRKKEDEIDFEINTPEFERAIQIFDNEKWLEVKAYGRNLGLMMPPSWNKGRVVSEIVKIEREQRKMPWTSELAPVVAVPAAPVAAPPASPQDLVIDPSARFMPSSSAKAALQSGRTEIPLGGIARITSAAFVNGKSEAPNGSEMTPERIQKMMQLRAQRQAAGQPV